jgi:hypothetical protein
MVLLLVEPGNSDDQCIPEDEEINEITLLSNEDEGFTLDPIDDLGKSFLFLFFSLVPWYLSYFEMCWWGLPSIQFPWEDSKSGYGVSNQNHNLLTSGNLTPA